MMQSCCFFPIKVVPDRDALITSQSCQWGKVNDRASVKTRGLEEVQKNDCKLTVPEENPLADALSA